MQPGIRSPRLTALLAAGLVFLSAASAAAAAAPPSRESVEELMRVMRLERTLGDSFAMTDMMERIAERTGKKLEEELGSDGVLSEERAADMNTKIRALVREELSWNKVRDLYFQLFTETYTQEEIDGQLAFYRSPVGQATLDKQPQLMEKVSFAMQERMADMITKATRLYEEAEAGGADAAAQKRTVADLRNVGTAMFSWLTDQVGAAAAAEGKGVSLDDYPSISREKLESILVPNYIQSIPEKDGWGHPYEFFLNTENVLAPQVMAIRSPGRDGRVSGSTYSVSAFDPESFDEDLLWADGFFVRWPQRQPTRETK